MKFEYLLDKIKNAPIFLEPFPHLAIKDFLGETHLNLILNNCQIHFDTPTNFTHLINLLEERAYHLQSFPGCTTSIEAYIAKLKPKNETIENYGLCYRLELENIENIRITNIITFMNSQAFENAIKAKFQIIADTICFTAIQKYLDRYEISPHPDIRVKCMTYLLSINSPQYTGQDTILFSFKEQYEHVYTYWGKHEHLNRCWVPKDWCIREKMIQENNTLLLFPVSNYSLHGIKLDYNHLVAQRTQIYGNLMYKNPIKTKQIKYHEI